ncbi:hypothetical protein EXIGLDRAFT_761292 [Exidia glandulosa HHB12029]|uniref:Uncharacterized protein n=1 Tax=Exidia glandulosa HHB12029 TaxID=1314781 RepID=A0A166BGZ9_EXIGL|nr:hypothetical protein EXIGLDRAFT_761292 [Exidia glandulosa HHB12029]
MHDPAHDSETESTDDGWQQRLYTGLTTLGEQQRQMATLYGWYEAECAFCNSERGEHEWNAEGSERVRFFVDVAGESRAFAAMAMLIRGTFLAYPMRLLNATRLKTSNDPRILARDLYVAAWSLESHFPAPDADGQHLFDWRKDAMVVADTLKHVEQCGMHILAEPIKRKLRDLCDLARHRLKHGQYSDAGLGGMANEFDVLGETVGRGEVLEVWDRMSRAVSDGTVLVGDFVKELTILKDRRSVYE